MSIIEMMLTKRELQLWKTRTRRTHEQSRHANKQTCSLAQISHPEALHFFQGLASLSHSRILLFETKPPQITDMLALSLLLFLCDQSVQSAGRFVRRPVGVREELKKAGFAHEIKPRHTNNHLDCDTDLAAVQMSSDGFGRSASGVFLEDQAVALISLAWRSNLYCCHRCLSHTCIGRQYTNGWHFFYVNEGSWSSKTPVGAIKLCLDSGQWSQTARR